MGTNTQLFRCGRPECDVASTGVCMEGNLPVESCPFLGKEDESDIEDYEESSFAEELDVENIRLPLDSGEALNINEVDEFLRYKSARFISIIGENESGKTTLICALYEKFLRGCFANYSFAGSRTLVGLEKKSYHSRVSSGLNHPDTLRTSFSDGLRFLHFSLVSNDASVERIELMISVRAGEMYQRARNNSVFVPELIEVKKAWLVVLLMDGNRLATAANRSNAMQSIRQTIQALIDGEALSGNSQVQIVITKNDLLQNIKGKDLFDTHLDNFCSALVRDFSARLKALSFFKISARNPNEEVTAANGLDQLLKSWCATNALNLKADRTIHDLKTEFDNLLVRTQLGDMF